MRENAFETNASCQQRWMQSQASFKCPGRATWRRARGELIDGGDREEERSVLPTHFISRRGQKATFAPREFHGIGNSALLPSSGGRTGTEITLYLSLSPPSFLSVCHSPICVCVCACVSACVSESERQNAREGGKEECKGRATRKSARLAIQSLNLQRSVFFFFFHFETSRCASKACRREIATSKTLHSNAELSRKTTSNCAPSKTRNSH